MNSKRLLITALLLFLANVLCLPLWTEYDYGSFVRTLFNKEAQLTLLYTGLVTGDEPFRFQSSPEPFYSSWYYVRENDVHRADLSYRARKKWQKLSLQLKSQRNGKVTLMLKGPQMFDEYGHLYSVLSDWKNFKINGTVIFNDLKNLSIQKDFTKQISVKKGETLRIEAEFRRHHFSTRDFAGLNYGNVWYLITGNLLLFFLINRLFSYLVKYHDRLRLYDTLLVVIFFPCLFIPIMNISGKEKSVREGRMLAVKPKLGEILKANMNTGGGV